MALRTTRSAGWLIAAIAGGILAVDLLKVGFRPEKWTVYLLLLTVCVGCGVFLLKQKGAAANTADDEKPDGRNSSDGALRK